MVICALKVAGVLMKHVKKIFGTRMNFIFCRISLNVALAKKLVWPFFLDPKSKAMSAVADIVSVEFKGGKQIAKMPGQIIVDTLGLPHRLWRDSETEFRNFVASYAEPDFCENTHAHP